MGDGESLAKMLAIENGPLESAEDLEEDEVVSLHGVVAAMACLLPAASTRTWELMIGAAEMWACRENAGLKLS